MIIITYVKIKRESSEQCSWQEEFEMNKEKNVIRGKKARSSGQLFEHKVRFDLESKGWIVDRWSNNVEFYADVKKGLVDYESGKGKIGEIKGKIIQAKSNRFNMRTTGFPDFICIKFNERITC